MDADTWSKKKSMTHSKMSHARTDTLTVIGNTCLTKALLETERRFFSNTEEETYSERGKDCDMSLSDREKVVLMIDKRTCCSRSVFRSVKDWNDDKDRLKLFNANYFEQCEVQKRELEIISQQNLQNCTNTDDNEENYSSKEEEDNNRFTFLISILDDDPALENGMSEVEKKP